MLEDTVCIVCGAGRGLGEATAKMMADYGASVVVNDLGVDLSGEGSDEQPARETANDIAEAGGEAMAHYGDVSDLDYTQQLLDDTLYEYGAVHSISNFAGILRDRMVFNMTEEEWDAVVDVHLKGHFALLRNAAAHWRNRYNERGFDRQRSFLCVSSGSAGGSIRQGNYAAAKAGVHGLARTCSRELHRYNVRVNALWPGALTRMIESVPEEYRDEMSEETNGPHLVAPLPTFIASEEAEDVNGNTLDLEGGELNYIADPTVERTMIKDPVESGGWTPEEIAENFGRLTEGLDTNEIECPPLPEKSIEELEELN